jgi:HK97 family phage prohead protease
MAETRGIDDGIYPFEPIQRDLYDKLESVAETFGMFDQGTGPQGAHYMTENPFADSGIACSNCAFYDGPRACEIVAGDIDPNAACKFWIIPNALLTGEAQGPATDPTEGPMSDTAPVRYTVLEAEQRRIGGRDVEFRTVETGAIELREAADPNAAPVLRGYAAVFDSPSEPLPFIETIAPGAFKRSLNSGREVRAFVNHNTDAPLATTKNGSLSLGEDQRGLLVEMTLPNTTQARDLAELVRSGVVHSWSFGFSVPRGGDEWMAADQRQLREVILHEVSIVTGFPAYPGTEGAQVRTAEIVDDEAVEQDMVPLAIRRRMFELNAKR